MEQNKIQNEKSELLIKKYYEFNKTKFNIFEIEQIINQKRNKIFYYIGGMVATIILIFTIFFNLHFKQDDVFNVAEIKEVMTEDVVDLSYDSFSDDYFTTINEINNELVVIQKELEFDYQEYVAFLNF
jgi:hypothetical protein